MITLFYMQTSISPHHDDCLTAWQSLHLECVMNPKWWNKIWNRNSSPYNWISSTLSSKSVTYYIRMWNTLTVFVSLHSCVCVKGSGLVVRDPDSVLSAARKTLNANKSSYRFFLFFSTSASMSIMHDEGRQQIHTVTQFTITYLGGKM